jgi:glycosyltransferase involved in cell wall biosynthesis
VVPEGEVEPLAVRLSALLGSARLRRSMGAAARSLAETRFDQRVQTERLERLYDELTRTSTIDTR